MTEFLSQKNDRRSDAFPKNVQPCGGFFKLPVMTALHAQEQHGTPEEGGPAYNQVPDAPAFREHFAMPILARPAAGAVSQPFGTTLGTDESRMAENAFTAGLATEHRLFHRIFEQAETARQPFFPDRHPVFHFSALLHLTLSLKVGAFAAWKMAGKPGACPGVNNKL